MNIQHQVGLSLLVGTMALAMYGCRSQANRPGDNAASPMPAPTQTKNITSSTPSMVATQTPASTATDLPPLIMTIAADHTDYASSTPPFDEVKISNDFVFESSEPSCELPCWKDITVGQSKCDSLEQMFEDVFSFENGHGVLTQSSIPSSVEKYMRVGNNWTLDKDGNGFSVNALVNVDTCVIESLDFDWTLDRISALNDPQRVLEKLGEPDYLLASFKRTQIVDSGILQIMIVYNKGIVLKYLYGIPIENSPSNDRVEESSIHFCLTQDGRSNSAYILEELTHGLEELTAVQAAYVGPKAISDYGLAPFEDLFGVSTSEAFTKAVSGDDACFTANIPPD